MFHQSRGASHFLLSLLGILSAFILLIAPMLSIPVRGYADDTKSIEDMVGDINGDGVINILDLTLLKLILNGTLSPNGNSDVDSNGKLNLLDPAALIRIIFGNNPLPHGGGGGGGGGPAPTSTPTATITPTPTPSPTPVPICNLTTTSGTGGHVTTPGEGTYGFNCGSIQNIVASASKGYFFINWTGDTATIADVNSASTTIIVDGNYSIQSKFTNSSTNYTLTPTSGAGGDVTPPGEAGPYTYSDGQVVNIVATPDVCYHFVNWTGDTGTIANVNAASTTITMNGNYSITANFAIDPQSLTTTSSS